MAQAAKGHPTKMSFLQHLEKNHHEYTGRTAGDADVAWNKSRGKTYDQAYGKKQALAKKIQSPKIPNYAKADNKGE